MKSTTRQVGPVADAVEGDEPRQKRLGPLRDGLRSLRGLPLRFRPTRRQRRWTRRRRPLKCQPHVHGGHASGQSHGRADLRAGPFQSADASRYFWRYDVEIANLGDKPVTLIERHWRITDADGRQQEVRGPGVVGEQPTIRPGEAFRYASGCPLATPSGVMVGEYRMVSEDGRKLRRRHSGLLARTRRMASGS